MDFPNYECRLTLRLLRHVSDSIISQDPKEKEGLHEVAPNDVAESGVGNGGDQGDLPSSPSMIEARVRQMSQIGATI